ncbi:MAG TPA: hypothetical protein VGE07_21975 [Herpetosiphonaceae bacterium]
MDLAATQAYADELGAAISYAIQAHTYFPNTPRAAIRYWDEATPYVIHPIWCAMTLLAEPLLDAGIRYPGAIALLWHDLLEDTSRPLPPSAAPQLRALVQEMTFANFDEELERLWERSDLAQLLKLYDKVSQFLDGTWLSDQRWNQLVAHTERLARLAAERYGELNILKLAAALARPRP